MEEKRLINPVECNETLFNLKKVIKESCLQPGNLMSSPDQKACNTLYQFYKTSLKACSSKKTQENQTEFEAGLKEKGMIKTPSP
jgi:hypothetical protein